VRTTRGFQAAVGMKRLRGVHLLSSDHRSLSAALSPLDVVTAPIEIGPVDCVAQAKHSRAYRLELVFHTFAPAQEVAWPIADRAMSRSDTPPA
jgi:hypothetical protein